MWCMPDPPLSVSVPESTTLRSVLVRATDRQPWKTLNARSQSDDALAHPVSLYFLFPSTSLEPFFANHNLTTHDLFPFLHLLLPSNSTHFPACIQHPVPCIDCSAARLHRPKPKSKPEPEPKPAPARHRKTHSETRSSRSLLYRSVHTLESTPNLQPVCLAAAVLVASPDPPPDRHHQ